MSQRKNLSPTTKMCTLSPYLFQMVNAQVDTILDTNMNILHTYEHNCYKQAVIWQALKH